MRNEFETFASLLSAEPSDAKQVAAWMAEREMEKKVAKMVVEEMGQDNERLSQAADEYDADIAKAQIRILSKQFTSNPDIVPYVAVVEKWDDGMWLVVPFSRYDTPATPGEMKSGMETRGLRVLQAWNGRTVQESLLRKSFLFGELPERSLTHVLALFRNQIAGIDLPESFDAERGTPIVEASDPRREYLAEEIVRLQPLSDAVIEECERKPILADVFSPAGLQSLWCRYRLDETRLAAATQELTPAITLIVDHESWKGECRLVSQFAGFDAGDKPKRIKFIIDDPWFNGMLNQGSIPVNVYKRSTKEFVGTGMVMSEDGENIARVQIGNVEVPVSVEDASDLVLILARE